MAARKFNKTELVRMVGRLEPYPAVLMPVVEGGWEVLFPNLAGVKAYGVKRDSALAAGRMMLSAEILNDLLRGYEPPKPSDPDRLIPDEDEPTGSELVMINADRKFLNHRLGIERQIKGAALKSMGVYGKK